MKNNIFNEYYNSVASAIERLNNAEYSLSQGNYITEKEYKLLKTTIHLLYKKAVLIGNDIARYELLENSNTGMNFK